MKILYFGKICDRELFEKKESMKQPYFIAQYLFEKALTDELLKNKKIELDIVSIYQTNYFPNDILFFKKKNKYLYLKFINLPFLREISYFISTCLQIFTWFIKNEKEASKIIYTSCHFPPVSLGIVLMAKILRIKKVVTFTDLSLFTYSKEKISKMKFYKKSVIKPYLYIVNKLQKSYDGYILFSQEMNQIVNELSKPYLVMEGIFNSENINLDEPLSKMNALAHAGTLNKEVGIETILNVFELIDDPNLELWLIGDGDMKNEIIRRAEKDKRIKYLGFMKREEVFEKLKQAKLLLNLRNPSDLYTKYSFPSKMFEYMVSGTPILTTKIGGLPKDYYPYVYVIEEFDEKIIKDYVMKIMSKSDSEIKEFGELSKDYILKQKNKRTQSDNIVNFLRDNFS